MDDSAERPGDRARAFLDHCARIGAILERRGPTEHWTGAARRMLRTLHERPHAQFPAYEDGRGVAMLTTDAIARWVAEDVATDGAIGARTVRDVLAHVADDPAPVFVARRTPEAEVIHLLSRSADPRRPGAGR